MSFFKKKRDEERFIQIGEFWYPINFYEMYDDILLQVPLLHFMEFTNIKEISDFLLDVRVFKPSRSYEIYERYIIRNARQQINLPDALRTEVKNFIESTSGHIRAHTSRRPERVTTNRILWTTDENPIFRGCKAFQENLFTANYTQSDSAHDFWQSPMFLAMHNYRTKRLFKFLRRKSAIPVDRLSREAFDNAMATSNTNVNNLAQMAAKFGITVEQLQQEMDNAYS